MQPASLTTQTLAHGVVFLASIDADLARIHNQFGLPPLWARQPGFPTLVHIILEQQVSLASARAAFQKLEDALQIITPEKFLGLNDEQLKRIGFSRQKAGYCRLLAVAIQKNELDLGALQSLDDAAVRSTLTKIKGVGPWTADIYLTMALLRPDIWPSGDLALAVAVQAVKKLPARPAPEILEEIASQWRPWRAVAARLLWHHYLSQRNHASQT